MDSIVNDLLDLFADTVIIEPWTGSDGMGASSYGAAVSYSARVKGQNKLVKDPSGKEQISTVNIVLAGTPGVTLKDRFTLPVRFTPQQPPAIALDNSADENGAHHERVYF